MSTTYADFDKTIAYILESKWSGSPPLFADNQPEKPPADATWVRWCVRPADSVSQDISGKFERTIGLLYFEVFTPETQGVRVAYAVRDKVAGIFSETTFGTKDGNGAVWCRRAKIVYAGKEAGWVKHNVIVPYHVDAPSLNGSPT
jgi:hypothetical protein